MATAKRIGQLRTGGRASIPRKTGRAIPGYRADDAGRGRHLADDIVIKIGEIDVPGIRPQRFPGEPPLRWWLPVHLRCSRRCRFQPPCWIRPAGVTLRMRLLYESPMYMLPAVSNATPLGTI